MAESSKRLSFDFPLSSDESDSLSLSLALPNSESTQHNTMDLLNQDQKMKTVADGEGSSSTNKNVAVSEVPQNENNEEQVAERIKFGFISVCGRRRDMEDSVSVYPTFGQTNKHEIHLFAVFDGHGCSHVSKMCSLRLHEIVEEEINRVHAGNFNWKYIMDTSFARMDEEILTSNTRYRYPSSPSLSPLISNRKETI